jgi:hypothetical protein
MPVTTKIPSGNDSYREDKPWFTRRNGFTDRVKYRSTPMPKHAPAGREFLARLTPYLNNIWVALLAAESPPSGGLIHSLLLGCVKI